jgi:hypothetical protein
MLNLRYYSRITLKGWGENNEFERIRTEVVMLNLGYYSRITLKGWGT